MRYLGLALFAEGVSDHRFLSPILRRTCEEICLQQAVEPVEIGGVHELHSPPDFKEHNRASRIHEAARRAADAFHILFVHADGQGDPSAAREERIEPAARRMAEDGATRFHIMRQQPGPGRACGVAAAGNRSASAVRRAAGDRSLRPDYDAHATWMKLRGW